MKKVNEYSEKSNLMKIKVDYDGETFSFNLFEELQINESTINREIKSQPSSYAFLSMLHVKMISIHDMAKKEMEATYSKIYSEHREQINPISKRPYDKELAEALTLKNTTYRIKCQKYIKAKTNMQTLEACVKAFEQRSYLIQTISANTRKN